MMIVNDDSRVVNKFEASLSDYARIVIYNCHMFIVHATDVRMVGRTINNQSKVIRFGSSCHWHWMKMMKYKQSCKADWRTVY
jgi:hypothetical protein